jgi:hypothetical protein
MALRDKPHAVCARKGCGNEFRLKRKAQRFCSSECRNVTWKRLNGMAPQRRRLGPATLLTTPLPESVPNGHFFSIETVPCKPPLQVKKGRVIASEEFVWRGLALHLGIRKRPVLTLVADDTYPYLFRIRYPDGWTSTPANISRAKDAAYGHALWLLSESKGAAK